MAYKSVTALAKGIGLSEATVKKLESTINDQKLSTILCALRCQQNLTQEQLAEKIGWSQAKVSQLEHARNGQLKLADLVAYTSALDAGVEITVGKETIAKRIQRHAFLMKRDLDYLVELAQGDREISEGVRHFLDQLLFAVGQLIGQNIKRLEKQDKEPQEVLTIAGPAEEEKAVDFIGITES